MATFGLSTSMFKTGFTSQRLVQNPLQRMTVVNLLLLICFQTIITFASPLKDIIIGSHNLHGFKKSGTYHRDCIQKHGGIWFAQELWLQERQLNQLQQLNVQFSAQSGMENAVCSGVLRGRPFGGGQHCLVRRPQSRDKSGLKFPS